MHRGDITWSLAWNEAKPLDPVPRTRSLPYRWLLLPKSALMTVVARGDVSIEAHAHRLGALRFAAANMISQGNTSSAATQDDCGSLCRTLRDCRAYVWRPPLSTNASRPVGLAAPQGPSAVLENTCFLFGIDRIDDGNASAACPSDQTSDVASSALEAHGYVHGSGRLCSDGAVSTDGSVCCLARCGARTFDCPCAHLRRQAPSGVSVAACRA